MLRATKGWHNVLGAHRKMPIPNWRVTVLMVLITYTSWSPLLENLFTWKPLESTAPHILEHGTAPVFTTDWIRCLTEIQPVHSLGCNWGFLCLERWGLLSLQNFAVRAEKSWCWQWPRWTLCKVSQQRPVVETEREACSEHLESSRVRENREVTYLLSAPPPTTSVTPLYFTSCLWIFPVALFSRMPLIWAIIWF